MATRGSLLILLNELPDPNFVLFPQTHSKLTKFTNFKNLPIELRLKVWRFSYPKTRRVVVRTYFEHSDDLPKLFCKSRTPPPPQFSVCRESRIEAKKQYKVLLGEGKNSKFTIYINYQIDSVVFPDINPMLDGYFWSYISFRLRQRFEKVHILELRNIWWTKDLELHFRYGDKSDEARGLKEHSFMLHFPALRILFLEALRGAGQYGHGCWGLVDEDQQKSCVMTLTRFFQSKSEREPQFTVPKILLNVAEGCIDGIRV